ncbi:MAG: hypothetical protein ABH842_04975 [Candidatus Micrarchaeota archaeon]
MDRRQPPKRLVQFSHTQDKFSRREVVVDRITTDVGIIRANLTKLNDPKNVGIDYRGRKEAFQEAIAVLDDAFSAYLAHKFQEFKFSEEFRRELHNLMGRERGEALFVAWRQETTATIGNLLVGEVGDFETALYGGLVRGHPNCQEPHQPTFHIGGVVGTIELPWIKQIVAREDSADDFVFRRRLFLVNDGSRPILLIQPKYYDKKTDMTDIDVLTQRMLVKKYERLGVEVRLMPEAMLSLDYGINTGYSTFRSGRSPFFYMDSNSHELKFYERVIGRNGLHTREIGNPVDFSPGWNGIRNMR